MKLNQSIKIFFIDFGLKESYLKWCGQGFYKDPRMVEFEIFEDDVRCLTDDVYCASKRMVGIVFWRLR